MTRTLIAAALCLFAAPAVADEGMWTPDQVPALAERLTELGYDGDAEALVDLTAHPLGAVIWLGNCTASFVSPQGLAATNHHCAYGSIQYNSTETENRLANGFLAAELGDELPAAPGSRIYVLEAFEDVTEAVVGGLDPNLDGRERYQAIDDRIKARVSACETAHAGRRCSVDAFHGGLSYVERRSLEIKDVRLVYAPAEAIGKFGGDIDNWMWPRHTGDFAFYRAYVAPDGSPAEYAETNVPYQPPHYLKVSARDLDEGDFAMVAGYPGSTKRYERLAKVEHFFGWYYPTFGDLIRTWIATIETAAPEGSEARVKYASRLAGLNNAEKNFRGQLDGARRVNLVERRRTREAALDAWIAADPSRASLASAIVELDALIAEDNAAARANFYFDNAARMDLLSAARRLYRLAKERQKPDAERERGYQDRDLPQIRESLQRIDRRFEPSVDRAAAARFIESYLKQSDAARVAAFDATLGLDANMSADAIADALAPLYAASELRDPAKRLAWLDADPAAFETSADPFIRLAVALYARDLATEEAKKARDGRFQALTPQYMQAIIAWNAAQGRPVYPDANSTLRLSIGRVTGGSTKDGLAYLPFTTLEGIAAKHTGEDPFDATETQMAAITAKTYGDFVDPELATVAVNFLSDHDITGGNSGSPVLNARHELIGLAFDGTYESINSDWDFDVATTRMISVDSRYMLWVMQTLDGADRLIEEMDVVRD